MFNIVSFNINLYAAVGFGCNKTVPPHGFSQGFSKSEPRIPLISLISVHDCLQLILGILSFDAVYQRCIQCLF
jgi:hypothetical protein